MLNRIQLLVLGFFAFAWIGLVTILVVAPDIYDTMLRASGNGRRAVEVVFVVAITTFLALLSYGVVRRWRWIFWLIVVAFLAGVARVPAAILQLAELVPGAGPVWYDLFQAAIGLVQFAIGLAMIIGYRRSGVWGDM